MKFLTLKAIRSLEAQIKVNAMITRPDCFNENVNEREMISIAHGDGPERPNNLLHVCRSRAERLDLTAAYVNAWVNPKLSKEEKSELFGEFFNINEESRGQITAYTISGDGRELRVWTDKSHTLASMRKCLRQSGNKGRTDYFESHFDAGGEGCLLGVYAPHWMSREVNEKYLQFLCRRVMPMKTITKVCKGTMYTP